MRPIESLKFHGSADHDRAAERFRAGQPIVVNLLAKLERTGNQVAEFRTMAFNSAGDVHRLYRLAEYGPKSVSADEETDTGKGCGEERSSPKISYA